MILVGFHRTFFSDIKLCVLEELQRSGNGLWFGEREGQTEPHSHQRQHLEQKRVFAHTLSIWLPDGSWAHICFYNFPPPPHLFIRHPPFRGI